MSKGINLTQGQVALVCDCHYDVVKNYKWFAVYDKSSKAYRAGRMSEPINGKRKILFMHKIINNTPNNMLTDHINGDTLDNRCENLRNATSTQNQINRGKRSDNSSGYKGVSPVRGTNKWKAQIQINKKKICLGLFDDIEDARQVRDDAEKNMFGEFARPNIPQEKYQHA